MKLIHPWRNPNRITNKIPVQTCIKCKIEKPAAAFFKGRKSCKDCSKWDPGFRHKNFKWE